MRADPSCPVRRGDVMARGWRLDARCIGTDPELFYPPTGNNGRDAKRICRRCPVTVDCLNEALAAGDEWGIWGGTAGRTRRAIIHRRAETAA